MPRKRILLDTVLVVAVWSANGSAARADHELARHGQPVSWSAEPGCPSNVDVRGALEEVGVLEGRTDSYVEVVIHRKRGGFEAVIDVEREGSSTQRRVEAESCQLATDAAVVMVGMLTAPAPTAPKTSVEATRTEPDDSPERANDAERDRAIMPAASARRYAGLEGFVDSATLPAASPGVLATLGAGWRRGEISVGLGGTLPASGNGRTTIDGRVLGVDVSLWLLRARGEYLFSEEGRLGVRAGLDAGVLHATGLGALVPATSNAFWMAAAAGPTVRVPLGERVVLHAAVEGVLPLIRPMLAIDGDVLHRPAPLSARGSVAVDVRW